MACSVPPFSVLEQCSTGTSQVAEPLCSSIPSVLSQVPCSWPAVLPALHSTVAVSFLLQPPHCGVSFHRSGIRSYSALASDSPISFLVNVCCPCISPLLSVLPAFCCCLSVTEFLPFTSHQMLLSSVSTAIQSNVTVKSHLCHLLCFYRILSVVFSVFSMLVLNTWV